MEREAFKRRTGSVILENVPIGVCDTCGYRYYHSSLLRQVEEIAARKRPPERIGRSRLPPLHEPLPCGDPFL